MRVSSMWPVGGTSPRCEFRRATIALCALLLFVCFAAGPGISTAFGWSPQEPPAASRTQEWSQGVSCWSATGCMAVGFDVDGQGHTLVADQWNGTSWALDEPPSPAESYAHLQAVSCTSSTNCVAVGEMMLSSGKEVAIIETWNGSSWTFMEAPLPKEALDRSELAGISCTSSTSCIAVGSIDEASELAERWNGKTWSGEVMPVPTKDAGYFAMANGISCVSSTSCTSVGMASPSFGTKFHPVADKWNGTSWTAQELPYTKSEAYYYLNGVSCAISTACVATGYTVEGESSSFAAVAEQWNGTSWTVQEPPPLKGSVGSSLDGVSCTSATSCDATGGSGGMPMREHWNGTAWTAEALPRPKGSTLTLISDISCVSSTACIAVGANGVQEFGEERALIESWNGTSWTIQESPHAQLPSEGRLRGVSCTSTTQCTAVGSYQINKEASGALVDIFKGGTWTAQEPPVLEATRDNELDGVSCVSSTACTAVGSFESKLNEETKPLVDVWNGTIWTPQAPPDPKGSVKAALADVSCSATETCLAVGMSSDGKSNGMFAESRAGSTWTLLEPTKPEGSTETSLKGVSCLTAACTAVGSFSTGKETLPLAETWSGKAWTVSKPPALKGATNTELTDVACASTSACSAVGVAVSGEKTSLVAERWNGETWTLEEVPVPLAATKASLSSVSCTSSSACTAVGEFVNSERTAPLAENWNGKAWSLEKPTAPTGSTISELFGVSCSSATACLAVGSFRGGEWNAPLAESR
jgi:hypothetical protein